MKQIFSRLDIHARQALVLTVFCGLYWMAGSFSTYQAVYLQQIGFSASRLGLLNAVCSGVTIASVSFWGMVSDKIGSLRRVFITILVGSGVLFSLIPQIPADLPLSPLLLLIFVPIVSFFRGPTNTFSENLLVRNCNELRLNYGALRSLGSFTFMVGSVLISALVSTCGVEISFYFYSGMILLVVIFVLMAREPTSRGAAKKGEKLDVGRLFHSRPYMMFLVFTFMFYIAATCEATFIPYFMEGVGVSSQSYGLILAYRATLEIPMLLLMTKLRRRFSLQKLLIWAALLMGLECIGFCFFTNGLPLMLLFCTFFGLGNGLYIGSSLNYVYELAPEDLKASAQAFFAAVSSVAGILGNLIGGIVFDAVSAKPFYLIVSALYCVSAVIFILSLIKRKEKALPEESHS